jgi:hypothetical protein
MHRRRFIGIVAALAAAVLAFQQKPNAGDTKPLFESSILEGNR